MSKKRKFSEIKYIQRSKIWVAFSAFSILSMSDTFSMFMGEEIAKDLIKVQKSDRHKSSEVELIEVDNEYRREISLIPIKGSNQAKIELIQLVAKEEAQEDSHLYSFIQKYLVNKEEIPEAQLKKILRKTARGVSAVLGGLAGIPYFEVGRDAGGDNQIVSWSVGLTNTMAISGIGSWSYFNLVKVLDPQSSEERALLKKRKLTTIPVHLASHALGLIVAFPTGYMAARYNTYKWLALISFGTDYTLKTNGFLTLLNNITESSSSIKKCLLKKDEEGIETEGSVLNIQKLLIDHLSKKTIPTLLTMHDEERENLISSLYQTDSQTVENYLNSLLSLTHSGVSSSYTPDTWKSGYPKTAFVGALSSSAFINVIHNSVCAYAAWGMLYDNAVFDVPMAALSTIPIFMLELNATIKTGRSLYDTVFHRFAGTPRPSLEHTLYPKLMRVTPMVSIALAGVTAYVGRFMVEDILTGVLPEGVATFLTVGGVLGPFLFASYANYSLMKDFLVGYARLCGKESKKKLVLLTEDVEKLTQVISITKPEDMKKFLGNMNIQDTVSILRREERSNAQEERPETYLRKNSRFRISCEIL